MSPENIAALRVSLAKSQVPSQNHEGLIGYIAHGVPVGGFLESVLRNDLRVACARADIDNQVCLWWTVEWIYNHVPSVAWGSLDNYVSWIEKHHLAARTAAEATPT